MVTADTIIDDLGGTSAVASALNISDSTVSNWRKRRFIPPAQWPPVVRLAAEKGKIEVSFETLARIAEARP